MEPKPKRIKIDVACEACRRRKVKCDGARPACGNCWKRTDLRNGCTYSSEAETSSSREKTADASPGNPERATLPKIMHTPDAAFTQPLMPPASRQHLSTTTPQSTTSSGPPDPTARRGRAERHPVTPSDASPSVVDSMTTVREDGTVTGEYFGSSSAGSFTNQIKAAIDARLGSRAETRGGVKSSLFRSSLPLNGAGPGGQADYVLPARKQADHLMDLYWYYVDPLYPFLDRQRFEHSYRALFAGTSIDADERTFVSILNIILALSTQLVESTPPEQRDRASQGYFTRAQDLLRLSLWDTGSIELIQCLLLMSQYLQSTNNPHQTWMIVGSAVRIAQSLGLHLPETSLELPSEGERDLVRRIWHGCLLMDRMIAITHGRPAMVSDQLASSVVLPSIPDMDANTEHGVQLDAVSLHRLRYQGFFHKSLELYEVINYAVLAFYSSTSPLKSSTHTNGGAANSSQRLSELPDLDLGKALQLDQRLTKWEKSLPSFLTMADEPETTLGEVFRRQAVILRIRLLHARMLLLRPMLARFCLSHPADPSSSSQPCHEDLSSRVTQQCAMACVEAAQSLISFIVRFQRHDGSLGLLPAWWYRVFYIYTAATVLIAARLRPAVFSALDISRSWNQAMGLLHDHEDLGPSPRRCAAALQILSSKMFQDQQQQQQQQQQQNHQQHHQHQNQSQQQHQSQSVASLLATDANSSAVPNMAGDQQQETFDMPFPYLAQDAAFDLDAISFDVNDFSWLNSMPGSL
ncbi:fungal specific transcription factor [Colletotrichum tabaci]|uniref:Fungal specific transcription factor n=1 Tax=Colletotrichum tabaci TaxID=1209068 RepID=A0AAV9SYM9_9PEZI